MHKNLKKFYQMRKYTFQKSCSNRIIRYLNICYAENRHRVFPKKRKPLETTELSKFYGNTSLMFSKGSQT